MQRRTVYCKVRLLSVSVTLNLFTKLLLNNVMPISVTLTPYDKLLCRQLNRLNQCKVCTKLQRVGHRS